MEEIMNEVVDTKSIERTNVEMKVEEQKPKPVKKERSQAQKDAFERARKKRAENLAQKKLDEEAMAEVIALESEEEAPPPPKKKRGRPKKSKMKKDEEPAEQFIQPHPVNPMMMNRYAQQPPTQDYFNPYAYYHPQPPVNQQPVVNNHYYYGEQEKKVNEFVHKEEPKQQQVQFNPQELVQEYSSEEEEEVVYPPDPRLKFRMAG